MENSIEGIVIANNEGIATVNIGGNAIQAVSNYPAGKEIYATFKATGVHIMEKGISQ